MVSFGSVASMIRNFDRESIGDVRRMPVIAKINLDTNGRGCQGGLSNSGESITEDGKVSRHNLHIVSSGQRKRRFQGFTFFLARV